MIMKFGTCGKVSCFPFHSQLHLIDPLFSTYKPYQGLVGPCTVHLFLPLSVFCYQQPNIHLDTTKASLLEFWQASTQVQLSY